MIILFNLGLMMPLPMLSAIFFLTLMLFKCTFLYNFIPFPQILWEGDLTFLGLSHDERQSRPCKGLRAF